MEALPHTWYICRCRERGEDHHCPFCDGGLSACTVCGGAEGSLLTHCPGFRLTPEEQDAIYAGDVADLDVFRRRTNAQHR